MQKRLIHMDDTNYYETIEDILDDGADPEEFDMWVRLEDVEKELLEVLRRPPDNTN